MRRPLAAVAAVATTAVVALTGCTTTSGGHGTLDVPGGSPAPASSTAPSTGGPPTQAGSPTQATSAAPSSSAAPGCPTSYAAPDPNRPRVTLHFTVSDDLHTVAGSEHIAFTPDLPITELVFRLTANTAPTVAEGNKIVVTSASADHGGGAPRYQRDGAAPSTQGGLLLIPFAHTIAAGTTVSADITFTLTLGRASFDRFGTDGAGAQGYAWFASAQPLLAWEQGHGWHTEPMAQIPAESATSEAMQTDLTVVAPAAETVIMSGDPATPPRAGSTRTWHATIATARDVSVALGPFVVGDAVVNGVKLRVGAPSTAELHEEMPLFQLAITAHAKRFGPFPFPSLSVARLPVYGGGIEYPSSILMFADPQQRVPEVHETAHQWFYAMVGDSQATDPWLDEAFASYAEELVDNDPPPPGTLSMPGDVGASVASYGSAATTYDDVTYNKGAAALLAARQAAGPARFDAAIRCYVNANAWRIARPSDVEAALRGLPAAIAVLRKAGAIP